LLQVNRGSAVAVEGAKIGQAFSQVGCAPGRDQQALGGHRGGTRADHHALTGTVDLDPPARIDPHPPTDLLDRQAVDLGIADTGDAMAAVEAGDLHTKPVQNQRQLEPCGVQPHQGQQRVG